MNYRCSGINAIHKCETDPLTWDRYSRYRNEDPIVRDLGSGMLESGIKSGNTASFLNKKYKTRIQPKDLHRIRQTHQQSVQSLTESSSLSISDVQSLVDEIKRNGDQYRIKFIGNSQVMQYLMYWDPSTVQLSRSFCQVCGDGNHKLSNLGLTARCYLQRQ
jgi:hypothetical protein